MRMLVEEPVDDALPRRIGLAGGGLTGRGRAMAPISIDDDRTGNCLCAREYSNGKVEVLHHVQSAVETAHGRNHVSMDEGRADARIKPTAKTGQSHILV